MLEFWQSDNAKSVFDNIYVLWNLFFFVNTGTISSAIFATERLPPPEDCWIEKL